MQNFELFKRIVAAWIGGLILGALLFAAGAVTRLVPLARVGLALIAISMLAQVVVRALIYQSLGKRIPFYSSIFLGVRVFGAGVLLYAAAGLRL